MMLRAGRRLNSGFPVTRHTRPINPPRIIVFSFATAIITGTILLSLPISITQGGPIGVLDALFTATSATCVTGLTVLDIGNRFSRFGQMVILCLIQAGGLGIMTLSTAFLFLLGKRLSFREQLVAKSGMVTAPIVSLKSLIGYIILVTLTFEFIGATILCIQFERAYAMQPYSAYYHALFHSVSAFCNAGFSLYPDNLARFKEDWIVIATLSTLVITGGLGFIVLYNILGYRFWVRSLSSRGRFSLQTKTVLVTTGVLTAIMALCIILMEWEGTMRGMPLKFKLLNSFFHAVTPRTAGFSTLPMASMSTAVLFVTIVMMFIGASPGSTGGGIKTCTLAVLVATSVAIIRGGGEVRLMRRSLSRKTVEEAVGVAFFSVCLVILMCTILLVTESAIPLDTPSKGHFTHLLFETVSAFGTVGLSTGVTPSLTQAGRIIIICMMFAGRVGPLTLALIILRREALPAIHYAEEGIMIG